MQWTAPSADTSSNTGEHGHVRLKDSKDNGEASTNECKCETSPPTYNRLPLNNVETFLHLLKSLLGTGILAMPKAFLYAGWGLGLVGSALIALISTYCVHLLLRSQYEMCRRLKVCCLSYAEMARKSILGGPAMCRKFAKVFGFLVSFFLVIDQIGTCCVYIIFVASNLKEVFDQYVAEPLDVRVYMTFLVIPLLLLNFIRNLKYLAPFSTMANLTTLISFCITFYYVFSDIPSISERKILGTPSDFPLFVGMVLFSMEAIGVVLPLRNEMRTPAAFTGLCGILNQVMIILTGAYISIGFFGYLRYGNETKGTITLNLPDNDRLAQSVCVMLSCSVLVSHALQCYVIIDVVWNDNLSNILFRNPFKIYLEYLTRTTVVLITIFLAVAVPNLEIFISAVGALCVTVLAILFPAIIDTTVFWYSTSRTGFYLMCIRNTLMTLFGIFTLIIGLYTSISEMFQQRD